MSLFDAVEMAPRDPILGLNEQFNADPNPAKVNLGVGVYYDENGKLPLLKCVAQAEAALHSAQTDAERLLRAASEHAQQTGAQAEEQRAAAVTAAQQQLAEAHAAAEAHIANARAAAALAPLPLPVLGADTDVSVDGEILGKPRDRADCLAMLARLSGRSHEVCSAVALIAGPRVETALSVTRVRFGAISAEAAAAYWDSGEPADKAGAYAIQGRAARWVRSIEGSYSGVVGLPLYETCELLKSFGVTVP